VKGEKVNERFFIQKHSRLLQNNVSGWLHTRIDFSCGPQDILSGIYRFKRFGGARLPSHNQRGENQVKKQAKKKKDKKNKKSTLEDEIFHIM
jgi:hypothetical protein